MDVGHGSSERIFSWNKIMKNKRHTIDLPPWAISKLIAVARECNTLATAGVSYGRPSWRALVKAIAEGRVICKRRRGA